ncbi:hypothetical protein [Desulfosarcina ovata]|uniref:Uncharacterized protein n=1 Tax=Desulfosarcina ovata subsp. ovata TaxID=2752305 RepID=A0A5K8A3Q9_9BACT|nr:hypothetical protein [Desulfosarcina ovata]BBO87038.1 hypothetical protein DSCOOX_02180 [Desulfosarcina ovata subsp. ovata]
MVKQNVKDILKEMTESDDITKPWPKLDLLFSLGFPETLRNNICQWHWHNQEAATLDEVFEFVISSEKDPRPGYLIAKMLDFRNVGIKTYLKLVNTLSEINFGPRCNLVWENKYTTFLNSHRVRGIKFNWSKPITEEGKLLAKFRNGTPYIQRRRKNTANQ